MRWRVAYDLRADADSVQRMAEVTRSGGGIGSEPAVIGSDQWWSLAGTDRLPLHTQEGEVERVYWSGHNDFAEFTLVTPDGTRRDWPRFGYHIRATVRADGSPFGAQFWL